MDQIDSRKYTSNVSSQNVAVIESEPHDLSVENEIDETSTPYPIIQNDKQQLCPSSPVDLIKAINDGDLLAVQSLLNQGVDVNSKAKGGKKSTALIAASRNGHLVLVKELIDRNANVDLEDKSGLTALMIAASRGNDGIVKTLLHSNAEVDKQDNDSGMTALMLAVRENNIRSARLLLENGANATIENKEGKTAIDFAQDKEDFKAMFEEVRLIYLVIP